MRFPLRRNADTAAEKQQNRDRMDALAARRMDDQLRLAGIR